MPSGTWRTTTQSPSDAHTGQDMRNACKYLTQWVLTAFLGLTGAEESPAPAAPEPRGLATPTAQPPNVPTSPGPSCAIIGVPFSLGVPGVFYRRRESHGGVEYPVYIRFLIVGQFRASKGAEVQFSGCSKGQDVPSCLRTRATFAKLIEVEVLTI
jgi:hypothetical protein